MSSARSLEQNRFLARYAREWAAEWPREARSNYAGELTLGSAYSGYRVIDGRCVAVCRRDEHGNVRVLTEHEALNRWLVGYLSARQEADGSWRFTLHRSLREGAKAVFWRPGDNYGDFVLTSRIESLRLTPPRREVPPLVAATPTTGVLAPEAEAKKLPPPLPPRRPLAGAARRPRAAALRV